MGKEEVEYDCRGMTEGFLLQSFFQSAAGVGITENFYCEKTLGGGLCRKSTGDVGKLIIPSRTNIMDLDRESGNRKALIQLNIFTTARQFCTRRIKTMR